MVIAAATTTPIRVPRAASSTASSRDKALALGNSTVFMALEKRIVGLAALRATM